MRRVTCRCNQNAIRSRCADGKVCWRAQIPLPMDARLAPFARLKASRIVSVPLGFFANAFELFLEAGEVFVGKFFQIYKFISSTFQRSDYFVEFQMSRFGIAVLRILNEKDHQESNNCRSGINNELPGI